MLPAIGQGAIGIECREDDQPTIDLLQTLHHPETAVCVTAERAINRRLEGGCQAPIAGHAARQGDRLCLEGLIGSPDGERIVRDRVTGPVQSAASLGTKIAENLLSRGGEAILAALKTPPSPSR